MPDRPRPDYYEILGVPRDADLAMLKRAYRELAWKYHPDQNPGSADAEARFKEISEAYAVLSDVDKRARYDRGEGAFGIDLGAVSEIFDSLLSRAKRRTKSQGRDLRYTLEIDFVEAARGCKKTIEFEARGECETCRGTGARGGDAGLKVCASCQGRGEVKMQQGLFSLGKRCVTCGGRGRVVVDACTACRGDGTTVRMREFEVAIPAGAEDGATRRLEGQGEPGRGGGKAGDLHVIVRVLPHKLWRREGKLLVCELPIAAPLAALGGPVDVPTLDGGVEMRIPPGTQSGTLFRLREQGLGAAGGKGRGDAHVRVVIETPAQLSPEQQELYRKLLETMGPGQLPRVTAFREKHAKPKG
jgi:molecular chaperone DnaJ